MTTRSRDWRLGIDLGGSKIAGVVLDADSHELSRRRMPTPAGDYRATLNAIRDLVDVLEDTVGVRGLPVGVGTPGSVVPATGRIHNANSVCLNDQSLPADLCDVLQREVRVANDADCLALSEGRDGAAVDAASVFAVILGTGVGGGLLVNGRLLSGPNGLVGEWGHNPLPWAQANEYHATRCWCGQFDCLETWLSGPALAADYQRRSGVAATARDIAARAMQGEPRAAATLSAWHERLARALAHVINLFDPHVIVLGGGLSQMPRVCDVVPQLWQRHVFAGAVTTPLRRARHGDASGVRGAARLWPLTGDDDRSPQA